MAGHGQGREVEPTPALNVRLVRHACQFLQSPTVGKLGSSIVVISRSQAGTYCRSFTFSFERVAIASGNPTGSSVPSNVLNWRKSGLWSLLPIFVLGLVIHRHCSQIDLGGVGRQGIGPDQVLSQVGLDDHAGVGLHVAQFAQYHRQPVIHAVLGPDGLANGVAQGGEMLGRPRFE